MSHPILNDAQARMKKTVDHTLHEFSTIHTGKASPSMVEGIMVEAYGGTQQLKACAAITTPDPRLIQVQPWDKGLIRAIEKAVLASDLGLTPSNDGALIRLPIPTLTEERRRDLVRLLHKKVEEGRVDVRTLRRHSHDEMRKKEKDAGVSADDFKRLEKRLQDLTDRYIAQVDDIGAAKEKEILQV